MRPALQRTLLPVSLACAALLAACGGGGGGGGNTSTTTAASAHSDVNASNYQSFSAPMAMAVLDAGGGASVAGVFGGTATAQSTMLVQRALAASGRATIQSATRQATGSQTAPCDFAGSIAVTVNDANNNAKVDAGDSLTVSATNCQFASADAPINGSFSMTVQSLQTNTQGQPTSVQVSGSFNNLSSGSDTLNGGFTLALGLPADGSESISMSFINLTAAHTGLAPVTYNLTLSAAYAANGTGSFSINGTLQPGSEVYLLEQVQPFVVSSSSPYPLSGALRLQDVAGDALELDAVGGNLVDFKFYPAGATQPSATLLGQPWSHYGS
jgi:hypothetical protein